MSSDKSNHKKAGGSNSGYYYYDEGYSYNYSDSGIGGESSHQKGIKDYLLILRERIWYVLIGFLLVFSLAIVVTVTQTPIYQATASIQMLRQEAQLINLTGPTGNEHVIASAEDFNTEVHLMQSLRMAESVAARLTGDDRVHFMRPYEKGGAGDPLTPVEVIMKNVKIVPMRMSLVVAVQYSHPDKDMAAQVANYFVEEYIDYNLRLRIEDSMKAMEDLRVRAESQRREVEKIETQLQEYRERTGTTSLEEHQDIATQRLRTLSEMLTQAENDFTQAETSYQTLREYQEQNRPLTDFSLIASAPDVQSLSSELSGIRIQIAQLSERYREKHPSMIQAHETLQQTQQELQAAIASNVAKLETNYESTRRNLENLRKEHAEQEQEVLRLSRLSVEYDNLRRESQVQQGVYVQLIARMRDTTISSGVESPSARIIDRARPPLKPSIPNIPMNLAMGILGGIGLGLGVAFFVAFIDDRVKTAFDIENVLGFTLLGIVPEIKKLTLQQKAQVVSNEEDRQVVEAFRTLHSSLKLNNESKFAQSILVTSTLPGEGKSFTSSNLAQTFAIHGEKTLIIDCDLRMPNIHKSLQLENKAGVIDVCVDEMPFEEAVQKNIHKNGNLDVLTTGGRAKNPTQILSSKNFERLVAEARKKYDRIVFDTPPLAAVSDALIILPLVDGCLFTIKFNKVKRSAAKHNSRRLLDSNVPVFGAVLNNLSLSVSGYYYAQYYDKSYYEYYAPDSKRAAEEGPLR
ncbi:MAG TPA: polysaccharide biosynthesis tyrosine autokinase [Opitutales bacterium]|nr:polysaccharide biosynthesis tyrosine autokinase [Opitutales bacterium]